MQARRAVALGGVRVRPIQPLFPAFLKLAGRSVLLVGGGQVAASKLAVLKHAHARVTVVAPRVCRSIRRARVRVVRRRFRSADLVGHWFVVSAATPAVNRAVAGAAVRRGLFVNAVDDPANASAYLGGVLRRGGITIAISTGGQAPALAGLIREGIEAVLPDDLESWLHQARSIRGRWLRAGTSMARRRPQLLDALMRLYAQRKLGQAFTGARR